MNLRQQLGRRGERLAAKHLRRGGYRIVTYNYECPVGEADLICADGDTLVFVEVKTRSSDDEADPREAARPPQWHRLARIARYFAAQNRAQDLPCRFDLVTVLWPKGRAPTIEHQVDAFQPKVP